MIGIAIITHGHFGEELLRTSQDIMGRQDHAFSFSVTSETGIEHVGHFVENVLAQGQEKDGFLFLVDMLGGTPCNAAMMKTKGLPVQIVTGINLYMLISAFTHRTHLDLNGLAAKVAEDGRRAIVLPKDLMSKRATAP